ncbi:ATP phosphoribosyltransferase regulatory subunit [Pacificispira sp.]|uniref:ATP phosphoribosyltransferase regulatory subunit n=1 Tax=Pacificispira sp. TaxID=2888761 RepID=UPI003B52C039
MTDGPSKTLLPDGLRDVLPPEATREATVMRGLIDRFRASAYRRVDPPLVEFEDSLLDGAGAATAPHTFRLMDPVSQRMMGLRADMTGQVARIATSRLVRAPRPLRLCYAGPVLRVRGSQLRPERQITQAGCELIGADSPEADAELIEVAVDALSAVGAADLSVDISLPTVVPAVCDALGLSREERRSARIALDRKDAHDVAALGGQAAERLGALLDACGPARRALDTLNGIELPPAAVAERERLARVLELLDAAAPELSLTVDPVEHRGFEYQTGLSFTLFSKGVRGELGRGGRYHAGQGDGEPSSGFSLYLDSVLRAVPESGEGDTVFLPYGLPPKAAAALRADGWCTLAALTPVADIQAEARRLGCSHVFDPARGDGPTALDEL